MMFRYNLLFSVLLFIVVQQAQPIEIGLTQGLNLPGGFGLDLEDMTAKVGLSISDSNQIDEAKIKVDLSPFPVIDVIVVNQNFSADFINNSEHTIIELKRASSEITSASEVLEIVIDTSIFMDSTQEAADSLGLGFGPFHIIESEVIGLDGEFINDIQHIPGSWAVFTDIARRIEIKVIDSVTKIPVQNAHVEYNLFSESPGIFKDKNTTSEEGIVDILYLHAAVFFTKMSESGEQVLKPDLDLDFFIRVYPEYNSDFQFKPIHTIAPLKVKLNNGNIQFETVTINVSSESKVDFWSSYN